MTDQTAKLAVLEETTTDLEHFTPRLAAYCSKYIMEIAKPIMERTNDLYADKAIVKLVDMWYEADREYEERRQNYLVDWFLHKASNYGFDPIDSYKWVDEKRKAYRQTLDALLIR